MRSGCSVQNHILACSLVCILAGWTSVPAWGRYIRPQLDQTPVERLVKNLNEQIKKDPKSVTARFNLARVHAMAFALKTDQAQTRKDKPERGAWFGYEPKHVPFTLTQTKDPQKKKLAEKQLKLAIQQYQQVLQLKPDHQSAQLGYAWCLQQSGETEKSIAAY
ncbi:MAG: tetratricopeptide repeat protein, partial [Pirellulaceae bacterium]